MQNIMEEGHDLPHGITLDSEYLDRIDLDLNISLSDLIHFSNDKLRCLNKFFILYKVIISLN